jgi:phosphate transport system substrate-binding protein
VLFTFLVLFSPGSLKATAGGKEGRYEAVSGVVGTLSSVGSDTLASLMSLWGEQFKRLYPSVTVQIQTAGSGTAAPALTEGTATLGPMSRPMKPGEVAAFRQRYGYPPTPVPVAVDALSLFVHRDNPIDSIDLQALDAIFSSTRRCGAAAPVTTWGQLGLAGSWEDRRISLFGRNSASGTYGFFKLSALCGGDFRDSVNEQLGSAAIVQAVSVSLGGLGYSGAGFLNASVRPVALVSGDQSGASQAARLARDLFIYVNKPPDAALRPVEREFLRFVLSDEGQRIATRAGYEGISSSRRAAVMGMLGLE